MPLNLRPKSFRLIIIRMAMVLGMLAVAACDNGRAIPVTSTVIVGTKAIFIRDRETYTFEVTDVSEKFVTTEVSNLDGDLISRETFYRGLYQTSQFGLGRRQWELEFDENQLESLFPLKQGNKTSIAGTLNIIDTGEAYEYVTSFSVLGEKTVDLADGLHKVMVIEIESVYLFPNKTISRREVMYYDPKMSMILKKITWADHKKHYWRVKSVEIPGGPAQVTPTRQRRSGTVMI
ncbi:MAG: hypothetical protein JKY60_12550 [Kordiimonadaceae bacterium]|nr:hypothetical protein [Kordiimonadaceae bacterium]